MLQPVVTLQVTQQVTLPRPTRATNRLIIDASHEGQIFTDLPFFMGMMCWWEDDIIATS